MQKLFLIGILFVFLVGCAAEQPDIKTVPPKAYQCATNTDCVSTCGIGCVNTDFAATYEDSCVNFRAFDCSCVQNECYTDGQPRA
ncbi:MAG: hypothetical protein AABW64_04475 [Nanoarchaeota archaeon]